MACIIESVEAQVVYDYVHALIKEKNLNSLQAAMNEIKNDKQLYGIIKSNVLRNGGGPVNVENWIRNVLLLTEDAVSVDFVKDLERGQDRKRRIESNITKINNLLIPKLEKAKRPSEISEYSTEFDQLYRDLVEAMEREPDMTPQDKAYLHDKLSNIARMTEGYFESIDPGGVERPITQERLQEIIDTAKEIKESNVITNLNNRKAEIDRNLTKLKNNELSVDQLSELQPRDVFKSVSKEIDDATAALENSKFELEQTIRKRQIEKIANEKGLFPFGRSKVGVETRKLLEYMKDQGWEATRAMKFMGDVSFFAYQAGPYMYNRLTHINLRKIKVNNLRESMKDAFYGPAEAASVMKEAIVDVFLESFSRETLATKGKRTSGKVARRILSEIKERPVYTLAKRSGLRISEARSLSNSEEVFTSDLVNKIPGFGALKDFSEDSMVSFLNLARINQFEAFVNSTDTRLDDAEYKKVADFINNTTGTTTGSPKAIRGASLVLSAPKLFASRLYTSTVMPFEIIASMRPHKEGKQVKMFKSASDAFRFREALRSVAGYGALMAGFAWMFGGEFEDDPLDKDFGRLKFGDLRIDASSGYLGFYRTYAKMLMYGGLVNENWMGFDTKSSVEYNTETRKISPKDIALNFAVGNRLHPSINAVYQTLFGVDFFNNKFNTFTKEGNILSNVEGAARALLPISVETLIFGSMEAIKGEKNKTGFKVLGDFMLSALGTSSYRIGNKSAHPEVQKAVNSTEFSLPYIRYPDIINDNFEKGSSDRKYFQGKYKDLRNNIFGQKILDLPEEERNNLTKEELGTIMQEASEEALTRFEEEFGNEIN